MNLIDMIKRHEGLRLTPYRCPAGHWTVGYGHNLEAHGEPIPEIITPSQAEAYLQDDIGSAIQSCQVVVPGFDVLGEVRQAVMIDMCFNLGPGTLAQFVRMLRWIKLGYWHQAASEMLDSAWAMQVGNRAHRLANMMKSGEWCES